MNGDNVTVQFIDAAGAEWDDLLVEIRPATRKAEDLAYPTTTGRSIDVTTTGAVGIDWGNIENPATEQDLSLTTIRGIDLVSTTLDVNTTLIEGVDATDQINAAADTALSDYGALTPTVAGRSLDVTAGGTAGIDWANIEAPTTEVDLSGTTIRGSDLLNSAASLRAGTYSNVTVQIEDSVATIAGVTNVSTEIAALNDIDGSAVTLNDGGITAAKFAAGAVDAAALADDAGHEIADQLLARDINGGADGGRAVTDALRALRNRNVISAVSYIVYQENDTTVAWHASLSTTDQSIFPTEFDPDT